MRLNLNKIFFYKFPRIQKNKTHEVPWLWACTMVACLMTNENFSSLSIFVPSIHWGQSNGSESIVEHVEVSVRLLEELIYELCLFQSHSSHQARSFTCDCSQIFVFSERRKLKFPPHEALRHSNGCYRRVSASNIFCRANKSEQWQSTKCKKVLHSVIRQKFNDLCFFYTLVRSAFCAFSGVTPDDIQNVIWREKICDQHADGSEEMWQKRGFMILNDVVTRVFTKSCSRRSSRGKNKNQDPSEFWQKFYPFFLDYFPNIDVNIATRCSMLSVFVLACHIHVFTLPHKMNLFPSKQNVATYRFNVVNASLSSFRFRWPKKRTLGKKLYRMAMKTFLLKKKNFPSVDRLKS